MPGLYNPNKSVTCAYVHDRVQEMTPNPPDGRQFLGWILGRPGHACCRAGGTRTVGRARARRASCRRRNRRLKRPRERSLIRRASPEHLARNDFRGPVPAHSCHPRLPSPLNVSPVDPLTDSRTPRHLRSQTRSRRRLSRSATAPRSPPQFEGHGDVARAHDGCSIPGMGVTGRRGGIRLNEISL
jgi:hypothetical protein